MNYMEFIGSNFSPGLPYSGAFLPSDLLSIIHTVLQTPGLLAVVPARTPHSHVRAFALAVLSPCPGPPSPDLSITASSYHYVSCSDVPSPERTSMATLPKIFLFGHSLSSYLALFSSHDFHDLKLIAYYLFLCLPWFLPVEYQALKNRALSQVLVIIYHIC